MGGFIPRHFCQHQCQTAEAGQAGEQQTAADNEGDDGKTRMDREGEQSPGSRTKAHGDLHLAHERQNPARAAIDRETGIHPSLGAAFHQHAALEAGALELFDGAAGAAPRLAKHIDRGSIPVAFPAESRRIEFVERDEPGAGDMGRGIFGRGSDIEQAGRLARGHSAVQFFGADRSFGLRRIDNRDMNI